MIWRFNDVGVMIWLMVGMKGMIGSLIEGILCFCIVVIFAVAFMIGFLIVV